MAIAFQRRGQLADGGRGVSHGARRGARASRAAALLGRARAPARAHEEALALDPAEPGARARASADATATSASSTRRWARIDDALPPSGEAIALRSRPRQRPQQPRRAAEGAGPLRPRPRPRIARRFGSNPEHIDAHHNLGVLLAATRPHCGKPCVCYCKVTTLSPGHHEARGACWRWRTARSASATRPSRSASEWVRRGARQPRRPAHAGRVLGPRRAGAGRDAYVEKVFDEFAASFDSKLEQLSYRAPQLVAAMLADSGLPGDKALDVLDAGCGTGSVRPAGGAVRAPADRRGPVGEDAGAGSRARRSTTSSSRAS